MTSEYSQNGGEGKDFDSAPDVSSGFWYFGARLCPFANRAWWAAFEKEIDNEFTYAHINLGPTKPSWYQESINPLGTVPCVFDDGKGIFESLVVCHYFNEKYPDKGSQLMPNNPVDRANVRLICARFEINLFYGLLMSQDKDVQEEKKQKLDEYLTKFNNELKQFIPNPNGPYLCGEFSVADIAVFPFIDRFLATLKHYRNYDLNIQKYDRLNTAWEEVKKRPAFQKASCLPEFYIQAYSSYANPKK